MYIKLLQWNIWYKEKIKNVHRLIRDINPDIICLQEVAANSSTNPNMDLVKELAARLNLQVHSEVELTYNDGTGHTESNMILSKFPIVSTEVVHLSDPQPGRHNATKHRNYIEVTLEINGIEFTVGTTHLSYTHRFSQTPEKKQEVDALAEILVQNKEKYMFTGDLNSGGLSYTIDKISDILKNAGPELTLPTWTTKPFEDEQGFKEDQLRYRLDYVFASEDINIRKAKIVNTEYSDHLPILVGFEI